MVVNELRGEKIDIVPFSEDHADFVAKALSPAKVKEVRIHEDTGVAEVIVPDYQLSLAIGKEGQNARLAARLTGWRVDIKSETQLAEEEAGGWGADAEDDVEYAEGEWVPNPETGEMEWHSAEGDVVTAAGVGQRGAGGQRGCGGRRSGRGAPSAEAVEPPRRRRPSEAAEVEAAEARRGRRGGRRSVEAAAAVEAVADRRGRGPGR